MILIFWVTTILLFMTACGFLVPRMPSVGWSIGVIGCFVVSVYGLYFYLGKSQYLSGYYSKDQQQFRNELPNLQNLLGEFRKEEYRLRCRLEENPNDIDAKWRLLDLLAIKALNNKEPQLAKEYWIKALQLIPEEFVNLKAEIKARVLKLK